MCTELGSPLRYLAAVEYIVTGTFVALFAWAAYRVLYLHWRGLRTTGTIVNIVLDKTSDGPVYNLVVRFMTSSGVTIEAQSFFGMERVNSYYRIGEQVTILYAAKNPQRFIIEGYDIAGLFWAFLITAGACSIFYWGFFKP